jgi:hypothetical protein
MLRCCCCTDAAALQLLLLLQCCYCCNAAAVAMLLLLLLLLLLLPRQSLPVTRSLLLPALSALCSAPVFFCPLQQACFLALSQKLRHHQTDKHFEEECKIKHNLEYPAGNSYPTSMYMMRKLVGCREVHEVEQHVCVNDCCKFNKLQPSQYRDAVDQKCKVCGERRFDIKMTARKERLVPRKGTLLRVDVCLAAR